MGFFGFFKRNMIESNKSLSKKDDDDDSKLIIGEGAVIDSSVQRTIKEAHMKYTRPGYNPQTRKQYYDDGSAHKKAIDNLFANGEKVTDPYSGAELVKKQRDAKIQFGKEWQKPCC